MSSDGNSFLPRGSLSSSPVGKGCSLSCGARIYAIAFNSETAKIPEDKLLELSERFHTIIFLYDTDATGVKESSLRVEEYKNKYNVKRVQLPLAGTKAEKDISDYFALGNSSENFYSDKEYSIKGK